MVIWHHFSFAKVLIWENFNTNRDFKVTKNHSYAHIHCHACLKKRYHLSNTHISNTQYLPLFTCTERAGGMCVALKIWRLWKCINLIWKWSNLFWKWINLKTKLIHIQSLEFKLIHIQTKLIHFQRLETG